MMPPAYIYLRRINFEGHIANFHGNIFLIPNSGLRATIRTLPEVLISNGKHNFPIAITDRNLHRSIKFFNKRLKDYRKSSMASSPPFPHFAKNFEISKKTASAILDEVAAPVISECRVEGLLAREHAAHRLRQGMLLKELPPCLGSRFRSAEKSIFIVSWVQVRTARVGSCRRRKSGWCRR